MGLRTDSFSQWRENRVEWHGEAVENFIRTNYSRGQLFRIREIAEECLGHLSERYAYDTAAAVLCDLQLRGKLKRQGQAYSRPERRPLRPKAKRSDKVQGTRINSDKMRFWQ